MNDQMLVLAVWCLSTSAIDKIRRYLPKLKDDDLSSFSLGWMVEFCRLC